MSEGKSRLLNYLREEIEKRQKEMTKEEFDKEIKACDKKLGEKKEIFFIKA